MDASGLKGLASLAGINIGSSMRELKKFHPCYTERSWKVIPSKKTLLDAPLKTLEEVTLLEIILNKKLLPLFFWNSKRVYHWFAIKNYWMVQI